MPECVDPDREDHRALFLMREKRSEAVVQEERLFLLRLPTVLDGRDPVAVGHEVLDQRIQTQGDFEAEVG